MYLLYVVVFQQPQCYWTWDWNLRLPGMDRPDSIVSGIDGERKESGAIARPQVDACKATRPGRARSGRRRECGQQAGVVGGPQPAAVRFHRPVKDDAAIGDRH